MAFTKFKVCAQTLKCHYTEKQYTGKISCDKSDEIELILRPMRRSLLSCHARFPRYFPKKTPGDLSLLLKVLSSTFYLLLLQLVLCRVTALKRYK